MTLALGLMMSLLIGHAAACTCSRHIENPTADPDCRSEHGATETAEVGHDGNACHDECICIVNQPSPYAGSKTTSKEFNAPDQLARAFQALPDLEFRAVSGYISPPPELVNDLSYSTTLKSLLPSRAPPRL